jgi:hypothetical protein
MGKGGHVCPRGHGFLARAADADGHQGQVVPVAQLTIRVEGGDRASESGVDTENDHGALPGTS